MLINVDPYPGGNWKRRKDVRKQRERRVMGEKLTALV